MPQTLIVVPCYNEASRLDTEAFKRHVDEHPDAGFLFVNDGSTDATLDVLNRLSEERPGILHFLDVQPNGGKAEAVRRGFLAAFDHDAEYIGYWDADLATPLDVIPEFSAILDQNPDIELVMGSRVRLLGRAIERRPMRHYLGRIFATTVSLMFGLPVYDTQCGAKLFRRTDWLPSLFQKTFLSRWIFDVELLVRMIGRTGGPVVTYNMVYEYPLPCWHDVGGSKIRKGDFLTAFFDLVRIYRAYGRPGARQSSR